eukprot:3695291-Prymnesium_polylepis.1
MARYRQSRTTAGLCDVCRTTVSHHHTDEGASAHWRRFSAVLRPSCSIEFARTWGDRLHCFSRAGK